MRYAREKGSHTALVYAALEARNAIEQLVFEIVLLASGGIDEETYRRCKKVDGAFLVLKRVEPDYRKLVEFTRLCLRLQPGAPKVAEWDFSRLRRYMNELSAYCHFQGEPSKTVESEWNSWLASGVAKIEEVFAMFLEQMAGTDGTGIIRKENMPPEVQAIWEEFRQERITVEQAKTRLQIIQPILRLRRS